MMARIILYWPLFLFLFGIFIPSLPVSAKNIQNRSTPEKWYAGSFSFSDELGGFSIVKISGHGNQSDPIIITQIITSLTPSTITIRQLPLANGNKKLAINWTTLYLQLRTINQSPASWIGYDFELQEELGQASIYGDGLSFNQIARDDKNLLSDRFAKFEVEHEPGDRLMFNDGWVDRRQPVNFKLFLLDLTPTSIFYLQQMPHLPAS